MIEPIVYVVVVGGILITCVGIVAGTVRSISMAQLKARLQTGGGEGSGEALLALEERVEQVQRQVAELAERQEFTERMLAQARERGLLSGPPK